MDATGPCALGAVSGKEARDFGQDRVEMSGLTTTRRSERIAMHRVAGPRDGVTRIANCSEQWRQCRSDGLGAHAADEREAAGNAIGVERFAERDNFIGSD